jgi:hypothetical protein
VKMEGVSFDMVPKIACFTLDLEPDLYTSGSHEILLNPDYFRRIETFFINNRLKLTTFVVANMLELGLPISEIFTNIDTEFELHSYSHDTCRPDSEQEILLGKKYYIDHFGKSPRGYRAPNGDISYAGLEILSREGFLYDASIFPSWRPELGYNYSRLPLSPWKYAEFPQLIEMPFAAIRTVRTVISMSFLKLFGLNFYRMMFNLFGFPEILVFDSHLHDFIHPKSILDLPRYDWRKHALMRNGDNTFPLMQGFVDFIRSKGYIFAHMSELFNQLKASEDKILTINTNGIRRYSRL